MPTLDERVEQLLRRQFRGATAEIEPARQGSLLSGRLIWKGFDGIDHRERQRRLRKVLDEELRQGEKERIGLVLTLSQLEFSSMKEEFGPPSVIWTGSWSEWVRLIRIDWSEVPQTYGAYAVATNLSIPRAIGTDPEGILHVGEAANLRRRIYSFVKCAGKRGVTGHMAAWRYASCATALTKYYQYHTLRVRWMTTASKQSAYRLEEKILSQYLKRHGELPPLNYKANWASN